MKNDYLWDKSGTDAEIEGFEDLLAVYRHCETDPPLFAAPVAAARPRRQWQFSFSFAFATAACAAVVIVSGIFLFGPGNSGDSVRDVGHIVAPPADSTAAAPAFVDNQIVPVPLKTVDTKRTSARPPADPVRVSSRSKRQPNLHVKQSEADRRFGELTGDEKYAYGQLMLALSITGTKLKVIQDTINGVEDPKASITDKNR